MKETEIKKTVRAKYGAIAQKRNCGCAHDSSCGCAPSSSSSCCGSTDMAQAIGKAIGYTDEELTAVPEGANLGLGCGNPTALAALKKGETVLDLGSGAGFDCFLAANRVGNKGKVIGIDMTPEMLDAARENATKNGYKNVEFRLGEIENLPVADNSVDVIISNCVINLAPDKKRVFSEAFRVLKPGGRLAVSDIVLLKDLPDAIRNSVSAYVGCVAGAEKKEAYLAKIKAAGFRNVKIVDETAFPVEFIASDPSAAQIIKQAKITKKDIREAAGSVVSIKVHGIKP